MVCRPAWQQQLLQPPDLSCKCNPRVIWLHVEWNLRQMCTFPSCFLGCGQAWSPWILTSQLLVWVLFFAAQRRAKARHLLGWQGQQNGRLRVKLWKVPWFFSRLVVSLWSLTKEPHSAWLHSWEKGSWRWSPTRVRQTHAWAQRAALQL